MTPSDQRIIPAISDYKSLTRFLQGSHTYCVLLDFELAELADVIDQLHTKQRKVLVHIDLIRGIASDEFGANHLIQNLKVDGVISIRPAVIQRTRKRGKIAILRIFLRDSMSLEKSISIIEQAEPDYVELLPAIGGTLLDSIRSRFRTPVICGGLISSSEQINDCLSHGAVGVTTSNPSLWNDQRLR
jgi:glycerol uptake operon antiterminator